MQIYYMISAAYSCLSPHAFSTRIIELIYIWYLPKVSQPLATQPSNTSIKIPYEKRLNVHDVPAIVELIDAIG